MERHHVIDCEIPRNSSECVDGGDDFVDTWPVIGSSTAKDPGKGAIGRDQRITAQLQRVFVRPIDDMGRLRSVRLDDIARLRSVRLDDMGRLRSVRLDDIARLRSVRLVTCRLTSIEPLAAEQQRHVLPRCTPAPDPSDRPASEVEESIQLPVLIGEHRQRIGKPSAVTRQVARSSEGDDDDVDGVEISGFELSSTHGVDMGPAGQSSQVTMKDQHHRGAPMFTESPPFAVVVDQVDVGNQVTD